MLDLDDVGIRRYLLGLSPVAEAEALEQAYFAQPEILERVRGVEHDLLDDYAAGRLDPSEKEPFESHYAASLPLRERVLAARALRLAMAGGARRPGAAQVVPAGLPRWRALAAIAAGLLLAVGVWLLRRAPVAPVVSAPPTSIARAEPTPMASPALAASPRLTAAPTHLALVLSPGLLRGQGGTAELHIPPGTSTVVLELQGDVAVVPLDTRRLGVVIQTVEGQSIWSGEARGAARSGRPSLLASVAVPAVRLVPGDYLAALSADDGTLYRYFFRISSGN